jgi:hypothetical protein
MFRFIGWLIKTVVLLAVGLAAVYFFRDRIAGVVVRWAISESVGLSFQAQKVEVPGLFPFVIKGTGFLFLNPPDFPMNRAMSGKQLEIELDPAAYVDGNLKLHRLHVQIDELIITVAPSGDNNLERVDLIAKGPEAGSWLARHITVEQPTYSVQRVLVYDYRAGPNILPLVYKIQVKRDEMVRNRPLAVVIHSMVEGIVNRTPFKMNHWIKPATPPGMP